MKIYIIQKNRQPPYLGSYWCRAQQQSSLLPIPPVLLPLCFRNPSGRRDCHDIEDDEWDGDFRCLDISFYHEACGAFTVFSALHLMIMTAAAMMMIHEWHWPCSLHQKLQWHKSFQPSLGTLLGRRGPVPSPTRWPPSPRWPPASPSSPSLLLPSWGLVENWHWQRVWNRECPSNRYKRPFLPSSSSALLDMDMQEQGQFSHTPTRGERGGWGGPTPPLPPPCASFASP